MLGPRGLQMDDGAAEPDEDGFVTLAVQNHTQSGTGVPQRGLGPG